MQSNIIINMAMSTSVVIPTYNEAENIEACLKSLLNQSKKADEIIIIDDGSTDNTVEIASKFPVSVIKSNHGGPGNSRNLGASKAKGDILVFVDADMTFDNSFLEKLTKPIVEGHTRGVFNTREFVANYDHPLARSWNLNNGLLGKERMDPESFEDSEDFRAILKSDFLKVGGFDTTGYTDSRTLVKKLGYRPTREDTAISYHANPETLNEIYLQSRWIGKRKTKFGLLGKLINFIKHSLPISIVVGVYKSVRFGVPQFLVFKIVYDLGYCVGVVSSIFSSNLNK